ncbi:hypothetical protein PInf_010376 [Phytophthora infestans]|nr:hypothetical protein PInf_010376 [Phytophthora infestans]
MATLFIAKCETVITGDALARAVEKDDVEMLRVLFEKSNSGSARDALARAVALNRVEMLDIVLEDSSSDTIEQALVQAGGQVDDFATDSPDSICFALSAGDADVQAG